jgi:hypothetical protein
VPVFGGTMAVALTVALNHKLNKRRERWFTELAQVVEELQDRFDGFDPESLAENEAFVDAVVTATRIVDRTSQREKIEVLRNAVLNSALPAAPDQDIQQLYFALIDDLTPTHMRLLNLLDDPPGWFDARPGLHRPQFGMMSSRTTLISAAMPDWLLVGGGAPGGAPPCARTGVRTMRPGRRRVPVAPPPWRSGALPLAG